MNTSTKIGFIGTGNMARAILEGLISSGYPAADIYATRRNVSLLSDLSERGIKTGSDNSAAVLASDVVVLSVKPQMMRETLKLIKTELQQKKPLIISVAAGISIEALDRWSGGDLPIVRAMPNTPSLLGKGACGLYGNSKVSQEQRSFTSKLFDSVGLSLWVNKEIDIDRVIAISGSGPAYYFLFMEKMIEAGVALGLDRESAVKLTLQTAAGAAAMATETHLSPTELRKAVTSPGGTTEQAILSFEANQLGKIVETAMQACADKAAEMTKTLCNDDPAKG